MERLTFDGDDAVSWNSSPLVGIAPSPGIPHHSSLLDELERESTWCRRIASRGERFQDGEDFQELKPASAAPFEPSAIALPKNLTFVNAAAKPQALESVESPNPQIETKPSTKTSPSTETRS
ncbi:hypothetical protein PQQ52_07395 [Paraburkholderia sediminicola]|uniref:hypothetical protein n=1 Tax=Paraburkholderia sediminicola TaxID=458836 RepID=UPI0038BBDB0C